MKTIVLLILIVVSESISYKDCAVCDPTLCLLAARPEFCLEHCKKFMFRRIDIGYRLQLSFMSGICACSLFGLLKVICQ